jgi:glycosyltransferase involved in cell wall biosynthesis
MKMSDLQKTVSIVTPAFNEIECIGELLGRLEVLAAKETEYQFEVIVIENGSSDGTWEYLQEFDTKLFKKVFVQLSRNFRMDGGLTAGLDFATGDATVLMTSDLQDPPEFISAFLRKWEEGYENIFGIVTKRSGTSLIRRINSRLFYKIANKLSDGVLPENASDFRLLDRKVYEAVRGMRERNRFLRGLVAWSGFRSIGIPLVRPERYAGKSKAYSFQVLDLAIKGILAHSMVPSRMVSIFGMGLSLLSIASFFPMLILWIFVGVPFAGFGTLVTLTLFLFSAGIFMMGILSEYIGLIYQEVKERPNYIVSQVIRSTSVS